MIASGSRPSATQKLAERVEDVCGEDAPVVDQQTPHVDCATSRAFSASAGTPSSKSARYGSSDAPSV